jgi:hypothetical protein
MWTGSNVQENQNWKTSAHVRVISALFGAYHNAASVMADGAICIVTVVSEDRVHGTFIRVTVATASSL